MQLVTYNVERWTGRWHGGATMVVYLDAAVAEDRARSITAELGELTGVVQSEYVAPAEAAKRLRAALGRAEQLLDGIDPDTLPASVELVLEPGARDVVTASPLFATLQASDSVDDVELVGEWADQLAGPLAAVHAIGWALTLLLGLAALIIVVAALELAFATGDREAQVARLHGAGMSFTIAPVAIAGAVVATVACVLALGMLAVLHHQYGSAIAGALAKGAGEGVAFLPGRSLLWIGGVSLGLGIIGGVFAGVRHGSR